MPDQLEVAKRFGVGGYPLLIVFRHGKQYNFTGERNEEGELVGNGRHNHMPHNSIKIYWKDHDVLYAELLVPIIL